MKAAVAIAIGKPEEVTVCKDVPEPGPPMADDITIEIVAATINPSDLLHLSGGHFQAASLPFIPGGEAVGYVAKRGQQISSVEVGDRVVLLTSGNWVERRNVKAAEVMRVPGRGSADQFAALRANPPTAYALANLVQDIKRGDWVIQNAANSAVGSLFIRFIREKGARTVNIVRREDAIAPVAERGGDVVLVDGDNLAQRVREATKGAGIRYGIDAIGGRATLSLASCVANGGNVVVYGLLSGEPCQILPGDLIARGITLKGFRLSSFFADKPAALLIGQDRKRAQGSGQ